MYFEELYNSSPEASYNMMNKGKLDELLLHLKIY